MSLAFAQLPCPDSPLRRLDPRWKLAGLSATLLVIALLRTLPAASTGLAIALGLAVLGRMPLRWYLVRLSLFLLFLAPFVLSLPFLAAAPEEQADNGGMVSWHGMAIALLLSLKGVTLVTLVLVLLVSASLTDTLKAAHALRVPGFLVQLFAMTYRYVFLLADELGRLRVALRVRGYRNRPTRHSYRTIGQVAGTLLVRSQERGERVGQAMRCRGFDGRFRSLSAFRTTPRDIGFFVLLLAGSAGLLFWDLLQR